MYTSLHDPKYTESITSDKSQNSEFKSSECVARGCTHKVFLSSQNRHCSRFVNPRERHIQARKVCMIVVVLDGFPAVCIGWDPMTSPLTSLPLKHCKLPFDVARPLCPHPHPLPYKSIRKRFGGVNALESTRGQCFMTIRGHSWEQGMSRNWAFPIENSRFTAIFAILLPCMRDLSFFLKKYAILPHRVTVWYESCHIFETIFTPTTNRKRHEF